METMVRCVRLGNDSSGSGGSTYVVGIVRSYCEQRLPKRSAVDGECMSQMRRLEGNGFPKRDFHQKSDYR